MSGKPETRAPPEPAATAVVRFSKAAALDGITATAETETGGTARPETGKLTDTHINMSGDRRVQRDGSYAQAAKSNRYQQPTARVQSAAFKCVCEKHADLWREWGAGQGGGLVMFS